MITNKGTTGSNFKGVAFLVLALFIISMQSIAVKGLGGGYPVLEMVIFRNLVALPFTLFFLRGEGIKGLPKTKRFRLHFTRGIFLFISYTTYMMGLVALPLAQVESIRFSGPIMITVLSVFILGEKVEFRRWVVLIIGFLGVLLIVQPGSATFNVGAIFILISVLFYAFTVITTRKLQTTESSASMAFFSSLVYLFAATAIVPITLAVGEIPNANPSVAFLFAKWSLPSLRDGIIMGGLGLVWAAWTYFMARAYSLAQASMIASFEYLSLPINTLWGFLFWREIPTWTTLAGAFLILCSGMVVLYLDKKNRESIN
ncbi:DMT family transporter [Sediminispirochaeta smaragdinae]|uniref:EamA domain-containing protein n=1 Tax=Sediminispirochaeta smaragdinae (strain DSM 11293 / JCM 15392 / SEBR 4228) TaxID=573413 RepID=E1R4E6_SEDSS|nr:DMT family transporter [Sediminispirochaeta smaragdinae]ADK81687.1 protein of unknown function DUF6 transmembrane [Sediminispirochaeta smaragdinae DSM 11293]